jgi:hypothetical protein
MKPKSELLIFWVLLSFLLTSVIQAETKSESMISLQLEFVQFPEDALKILSEWDLEGDPRNMVETIKQIRVLEKEKRVKVISRGGLMTMSGKTAQLIAGGLTSYVVSYGQEKDKKYRVKTEGVYRPEIVFRNTGMVFDVRPIAYDGYIQVDIVPELVISPQPFSQEKLVFPPTQFSVVLEKPKFIKRTLKGSFPLENAQTQIVGIMDGLKLDGTGEDRNSVLAVLLTVKILSD